MGSTIYINFHGVGEPHERVGSDEVGFWISRQSFQQVLDLVVHRRDVCITFDDGNRSDVDIALPELKSRGLKAEFFICAARMCVPQYLDASDLRTLLANGMGVGSHGWHHVAWKGLPADEQEREWVQAPRMLTELAGTVITSAACPFGSYDATVIRGLRRAGIERIYTSDRAWSRQPCHARALVPRFTITSHHLIEDVKRMLVPTGPLRTICDQVRMSAKRFRGILPIG